MVDLTRLLQLSCCSHVYRSSIKSPIRKPKQNLLPMNSTKSSAFLSFTKLHTLHQLHACLLFWQIIL